MGVDCFNPVNDNREQVLNYSKYSLLFQPVYIYQPLHMGRMWHKVNFLSGLLQVWIKFSFS